MRTVILFSTLLFFSGCGVESVGTAATVAKLQADQAKQGKENMDLFKAKLDEANKASAENVKRTEEASNN
ncbi:hypothetical protein [Propionivibrio sp.]|uniref:hypothetical protein n=1 Tax=Propionivibrio sp. TaxID=2212460 RepID=UPI003BF0D345